MGGIAYWWPLAAGFVIAYLLGSIPFGLVLTKLAGLGDIRRVGSGNIGATNVLRTGRKDLAALTLLLDGGKGAAAVAIGWRFGQDMAVLAAYGSVLGHIFPVWLRFRGGKGVATTLGVLIALSWPVGLVACGLWLATAAIARISSLAAIVALAGAPVAAWWLADPERTAAAALIAAVCIARHHANIRRIIAGTEPRIGQRRQAGGQDSEKRPG